MTGVSPFAPARFPDLEPVAGVRFAGAATGLKKAKGVHDLMLAEFSPGTTAAGVYTRSLCPSAPVEWCRGILPGGKARGLVVNSGNANAFTGTKGDRTVEATAKAAAEILNARPREIFVASTGVIGNILPDDAIPQRLPALAKSLAAGAWQDAARAIMTTDTFPKAASRTARIGDGQVTIAGIAKGSGMIAPDMATMLSFVFTDAKIPADVLQAVLKRGADRSFNAITVDSDTSTSDTLMLFATGQARHPKITAAGDRDLRDFRRAVEEVLVDLATQVVKDGEGASKFITIDVTGAASARAARRIGLSIANSPLVKTAIAGEDANWGRIVMAVGKAGEKADRDRLSIAMGGVQITRDGQLLADYDEAPVARHLKGREVNIAVDIGIGHGRARVWTCDLTHEYIAINADYRS
ncbi:MAG: bifunctional glutamate N-acetyltransferase/amino-acid acetyltransferase ArgJ [Alphaproteobacteria bacterium]|nr:bifunctional glutamate N-acetyltransferase/amino-acid acetyltransferase ArgJ [Alphaproteobacteria bacterium]